HTDEHTTAQGKQIHMLRVQVAQVDRSTPPGERPKQDGLTPALTCIRQEPGIIGVAGTRTGDAFEIKLQSIVDPQAKLGIEDAAALERGIACDGSCPDTCWKREGCADRVPPSHSGAHSTQRDDSYQP